MARFNLQATTIDARTGRLFVVGDTQVLVVDTHTGRVLTTVALDGRVDGIALDERHGRVYLSQDGSGNLGIPTKLVILDARSGAVLRRIDVGDNGFGTVSPGPPAVDEWSGRLFLPFVRASYGATTITDSVAVFDAGGHLLRTTTIGRFSARGYTSLSVLVDSAHGRAIVPDPNTGIVSILDTRTGVLVRALHLGKGLRAGWSGSQFGSWGLDARCATTPPPRRPPTPSRGCQAGCGGACPGAPGARTGRRAARAPLTRRAKTHRLK